MSLVTTSRWLRVIVAAALIALGTGAIWFYRAQEDELRERAESELQAVAQLKVGQIVAWRAERLGDAAVLAETAPLSETIVRWLEKPQGADREVIIGYFRVLQRHYRYENIVLADADGNARLSLNGRLDPFHEEARSALTAALQGRRPVLSDLHFVAGSASPHLDAIAPLFVSSDPAAEPAGAIFLQSDAGEFLYPLIQSWPTASDTAETLIVRRDGDAVLFLNELRHLRDAALSLRIPLDRTDVPAVKAVLGAEEIVEGRDYRGVDVLSMLLPVPDSPWYVIAKVDMAEVFADLRLYGLLMLGLLGAALVTVVTAGWVAWERNQKQYYRALLQAEKAHQESEARYQTTLLSIGDGVIVTDADGCIVLLNPEAEAVTGWSQAEARGRALEDIFPIFNESTGQIVENPARRVMREGIVVGLANHTLLLTRDGREVPIADSGAPIRNAEGMITGVVLVFRDQTEERAAQRALRKGEEKFQKAFHSSPDAIIISRMRDGELVEVNEGFCRLLGYSREEAVGSSALSLRLWADPRDRERCIAKLQREMQVRQHVFSFRAKSGRLMTCIFSAELIDLDDEPHLLSTIHDITERRRTEEALRRYADRLAAINRLDRIISSGLDLTQICERFVRELLGLMTLDRTAVTLLDATGDQWQIIHQWTREQPALAAGEWQPVKGTSLEWLVANAVPFLENEAGERGTWTETALLQREGIRSRLLLPLIIQEQVVGALTAGRREPSAFSEDDQHMLTAIADQLALAIQNVRLYEQVRLQAAELEQRVAERTAELSDLYNNAPCGYHSLNADGVFERVNDTELAWLGYTRGEIVGKMRFPDLLTPASVATFDENFPVFRQRGWVRDLEFEMVRKDGSILPVLLSATAIYDGDGRYLTSRSTMIDHTARRQAEEALQQRTTQLEAAVSELEAFSYSISHDLRAPLRAVDGFSRMVMRDYGGLLPAEGQRRLQTVRDSAQQMGQLIDDLLAFSRLSRQPIQKHTVATAALVRLILDELSHEFEDRQIEIVTDDLPDCQADPGLLKQVFVNLLSNAVKFTALCEAARIEVGSLKIDKEQVYFVRDNGVGFDMQYADKLFGVFQRLHRAEDFEGTGVGLAIVQRIVHRHGGRVWAESQIDQGATFYFTVEG